MKKALVILFALMLSAQAFAQFDMDVFYFRGRMALEEGKYSEAIENFNVIAQQDTSDYYNFFFRGIAKYNLGDLRGAQRDFDTSVRLNPVFTDGFHYRAITRSRFGDYDGAFEDYERAIMLRPGFNGLYFSRGVTYFLSQQFDKAVKDFDRYIKKDSKDPSAYLNRGAAYLFLSDTLKALDDYNKAIKLDRSDPEGFIRRGMVYANQGRLDEAVSDMNHAIELDSLNTYAYFNRALMYYDKKDFNKAMADLNRVLEDEPGNALTLYNRSLISAQVGNYEQAISDMDRVININPKNVLAYYNRAAYFLDLERWQDALADYNKAIELYPDFAKAYMNRSYVESMLGLNKASKADYDIAQQKVKEYWAKNETNAGSFADTTQKYNSLIALDADFAKKDFDDEMLQHRDIDIRLRPLYRFAVAKEIGQNYALQHRLENSLVDKFVNESPVPLVAVNEVVNLDSVDDIERVLYSDEVKLTESQKNFLKGLIEVNSKQYNTALNYFDKAVEMAEDDVSRDRYAAYYKAFYLMNRAVLRADMIDFIASIQNNVQTLTMDSKQTTRARVSDQVNNSYDYSEALADLETAVTVAPDVPYLYFDLGNLYCLSSQLVQAIDSYDKAISLYPYMGDAYFNRGLVLIYLKDKEKGCIDLSRAGEMGVKDAYSVISKYCEED